MTLKLADTPKTTWNQFPSVPANNLSRPVERKIHRKKLKRFLLASGNSNFIQHLKGRFLTKAHAQRARRYNTSTNLVPRGRDPFGQRRVPIFPAHDKRDPWGRGCRNVTCLYFKVFDKNQTSHCLDIYPGPLFYQSNRKGC